MSFGPWKRAWVRPKTGEAEDLLRAGHLPLLTDLEVYEVTPEVFEAYFPLFNDLERVCGVGGADHELEEVEPERLENVLPLLKTYHRRTPDGTLDARLDDLLDRTWGLCFRAHKEGRSVFLVL